MERRGLAGIDVRADGARDTLPAEQGGRSELLVLYGLFAIMGAIVGFLLSGRVSLGMGTFFAFCCGGFAGWWVRGCVDREPR